MGWLGCTYAKPYVKAHQLDCHTFRQSDCARKLYNYSPVLVRITAVPIVLVWAPVKTALSPVVDAIGLLVFPLLAIKNGDSTYIRAFFNAFAHLSFVATLAALTTLSIGTTWQTTMVAICITVASLEIFSNMTFSLIHALIGPLNKADDKYLISTLSDKWSCSETGSCLCTLILLIREHGFLDALGIFFGFEEQVMTQNENA